MAAVSAVVAIIGLGVGVASSERQMAVAQDAADEQKKQIKKQEKQLLDRQDKEAADSLRDTQLAEKRAKTAMAGGKSSTILTSPLGIIDEETPKKSKTLLGQ